MRRLYSATANVNLKSHHHVKITQEHRLDLLTWKWFLLHPSAYCRPFMQLDLNEATTLDMFADASRNFDLGFGAYCGLDWTYGKWDKDFCVKYQPKIEYLELYAVTVAVLNWLMFFKNMRIVLFCDNQAVVNMINNTTSGCANCMVLIRIITVESLIHNPRVFARFV